MLGRVSKKILSLQSYSFGKTPMLNAISLSTVFITEYCQCIRIRGERTGPCLDHAQTKKDFLLLKQLKIVHQNKDALEDLIFY